MSVQIAETVVFSNNVERAAYKMAYSIGTAEDFSKLTSAIAAHPCKEQAYAIVDSILGVKLFESMKNSFEYHLKNDSDFFYHYQTLESIESHNDQDCDFLNDQYCDTLDSENHE